MNNTGIKYDEIDRLMQEAELYETQGLYEQAVRVYHDILNKEPGNQKAQSRITLIERAQRAEDISERSALRPEELSPRLALDLGLAYMGMNLYTEAIEEFARALKTSPAMRPDLLRYTVACLVHMDRLEKARTTMDQLLVDQSLTLAEKGNIVSDIANLYLEKELPDLADSLLQRLTDQQKTFVRDYDKLIGEASHRAEDQDFELEIEDTDTGKIYKGDTLSKPVSDTRSGVYEESEGAAIPLRTSVSYSLDSRNWHDGITESVSAQWAWLQLDEPVNPGDSLVVQFRLPVPDEDDVISIISKVSDPSSSERGTDASTVKVEFVSFLPRRQRPPPTCPGRRIRS